MPKLTHILKLILFGPQPKDELYEEWSKDPLAEWFCQQVAGASSDSKWRILRCYLRRERLNDIVLWSFLLCVWLMPNGLSSIGFLGFAVAAWVIIGGWKSRNRKCRPSGRIDDLFYPTAHIKAVIDLWSCGFRGRDVAKIAYLQRTAGVGFMELMTGCALIIAAQMLIASWGKFLQSAAMVVILLFVLNHVRGFCFHRRVKPFGTWLLNRTKYDLPGIRALGRWELSEPGGLLNRLAVPLWPLIASPVLVYAAREGASVGLITELSGNLTLLLMVIISIVLMHALARGRTVDDLAFVEDVFEVADRDFDQWMRKELIGDEDARGT
jgi:hypothetical protein